MLSWGDLPPQPEVSSSLAPERVPTQDVGPRPRSQLCRLEFASLLQRLLLLVRLPRPTSLPLPRTLPLRQGKLQ